MDNNDWIKIEIEQIFQTIRGFLALEVQVLSVLLAANVTVLGFGVSQQSAGPFLIGAFISIIALVMLVSFDGRIMSPIYYRAMALRAKIGKDNFDFFPLFFSTFYYPELPQKIEAIYKIRDIKLRTRMLRGLFTPWKSRRYLFVAVAALAQLALIPLLYYIFGWKFP